METKIKFLISLIICFSFGAWLGTTIDQIELPHIMAAFFSGWAIMNIIEEFS